MYWNSFACEWDVVGDILRVVVAGERDGVKWCKEWRELVKGMEARGRGEGVSQGA